MTLAHDSDFVKLCLEIPHDIEHVQNYADKRQKQNYKKAKSASSAKDGQADDSFPKSNSVAKMGVLLCCYGCGSPI